MSQKTDALTAELQQEQLHSAARDGNLAEIERLLVAKYPVNRFDFIGYTPLHYASANGHLAAVDRLLRAGANVNAHDEQRIGNTPLGDIAGKCSFEMAKKLIDAGADPTIPGWMQKSAIDRAKQRKDADGLKIQQIFSTVVKRDKFKNR